MKEIIVWIAITGLAFIAFIGTLILAIVKKRLKLVFVSVAIMFIGLACSGWTAYLFLAKSYESVKGIFEPRTGEEIYEALFGKTDNKCLTVIKSQDQVVPKIDYAIWLHFKTCPDELKRVLQLHSFQFEKQSSKAIHADSPSENDKWFKPENLGDSVLIFKYKKDEYGNGQTLYSSLDSTEVYCVDVLD